MEKYPTESEHSQEILMEEGLKEFQEKEVNCERCGGETGVKMAGDESYRWCGECMVSVNK